MVCQKSGFDFKAPLLKYFLLFSQFFRLLSHLITTFNRSKFLLSIRLKILKKIAWLSWFGKKVALTLKLHYSNNSNCSFIKFALYLLPYVDNRFCKYETNRFISFHFMAKTEGPNFIESTCMSQLQREITFFNILNFVAI